MTGMKEGAGENPFADDDEESDETNSKPKRSAERDQQSSSDDEPNETESRQRGQRQMQIPYKFRRDGVQDGRNRVPLFLQKETKDGEREAQRELEDRFDDDVSLTDLREALVMVGLDHLDEVEGQLREWGYGMTFDN
jgi:DNA segregation ATPase FtsK/SpoIIIE-like protein